MDIEDQAKILSKILTPEEIKSAQRYTGRKYKYVNDYLRCTSCESKDSINRGYESNNSQNLGKDSLEKIIISLQSAFDKLPVLKFIECDKNINKVLYRGICFFGDTKYDKKQKMDNFLKQDMITDFGFVSTSTDPDVAVVFASPDGFIMKIYLSNKFQNKILPLRDINDNQICNNSNDEICDNSGESEVLLPNNSRFICLKGLEDFPDEEIEQMFSCPAHKFKIRSYLYIPPGEDVPLASDLKNYVTFIENPKI